MAIERILKGLSDLNVAKLYQTGELQQGDKSARPEQTHTRPDEVVLSQRGVELRNATRAARDASDVRQHRVDELRKQIQAGTYRVNDEDLLQKLMSG